MKLLMISDFAKKLGINSNIIYMSQLHKSLF